MRQSLSNHIGIAVTHVFETWGIAASYSTAGAAEGQQVTVVLTQGANPHVDADYAYAAATIRVRASDVQTPSARDRFVVDGVEWLVEKVLSSGGGVWRLAVYSDLKPLHG